LSSSRTIALLLQECVVEKMAVIKDRLLLGFSKNITVIKEDL